MEKSEWKALIVEACQGVGTYKPSFDAAIDTLAAILERRDNAQEKFEALGGQTVVTHTNKGGAKNIVKHPALSVVMECEAQALSYWRDLGLTPAGLKKINETALKAPKGESALERALKNVL